MTFFYILGLIEIQSSTATSSCPQIPEFFSCKCLRNLLAEAYLGPCQTMMELLSKIVNGKKSSNIFSNNSTIDVSQGRLLKKKTLHKEKYFCRAPLKTILKTMTKHLCKLQLCNMVLPVCESIAAVASSSIKI